MTDNVTQTHTPGPLIWQEGSCHINNPLAFAIIDTAGEPVGIAAIAKPHHERTQNARLLAAAYTSYDKHCGADAIKCAEGDLLGQALELINHIVNDDGRTTYEWLQEQGEAILAKAGKP